MSFDAKQVADELAAWTRNQIIHTLKKRGAVIGISGGIDSSVVAAICVRAIGAERVTGIAMPEKDSSPESLKMARELADKLNIEMVVEDMTTGLEGMGAYRRRDEAVKKVFPEYQPGWDFKITLQSNPLLGDSLNIFRGTVADKKGLVLQKRLPLKEYLQIVAASNMKQRLRMTMLYYHAELRNYVVAGTGNKNEHELGFFVKYGDGGSDLGPILHLYKTNIFQLAEELDIPRDIISRPPTTDTYPGEVTQEEFFYRLPFATLDSIWEAFEDGISVQHIAQNLNLKQEQVQRVITDISQKKQNTEYLRLPPLRVR
ncbi:NAD(+) synthase [candidate division KSB1 bacterium]|nr:NAD(+) synthase [candidate division KSB1 bacterium]